MKREIKTNIEEKERNKKETERKFLSSFDSFIGQTNNVKHLKTYISAAKDRNENLDHILFYGQPGLGKTTLSKIIASEMNSEILITSATTIEKTGDMASILSRLKEGDVLFIDEIHRLPIIVEEMLYTAMENFAIDILIGQGEQQKPIRLELPNFTLIGATTRVGKLSEPLRDRFGIILKLETYEDDDLKKIILNEGLRLGDKIDDDAALMIAKISRGVPRIALKNYKRIRDFAEDRKNGVITKKDAKRGIEELNIDENGLNVSDIQLLKLIHEVYEDGPVGIKTIAATLNESIDTIEDVYEPFLLKNEYIARTPQGRCITIKGLKAIGVKIEKQK